MPEADTIARETAVAEVRKACSQFAMLYFHFAKVLVEELGIEKAKPIIQKAVFELALERSDGMRRKAEELGIETAISEMMKVTDIPFLGWVKALGRNHCPYAEKWLEYYEEYPWFKEIAPFYCDVIDTTNAENFTRTTSHRLTKNVLCGDESCEREYFPSDVVARGDFSYGHR